MATEHHPLRQIGDPILHARPTAVDFNQADSFSAYSDLLKQEQQLSGGVGIACNQYAAIAAPQALFWVGSDDEATRAAAALRYPGDTIPHATLMINPEILSYSAETYFPEHGEGCLSVAGPLRGKVRRHRSVSVRYQTMDGATIEKECTGFEAHIIQHEYDHLQGLVFLQKILADCSAQQIASIRQLLQQETERRQPPRRVPVVKSMSPIVAFERDGNAVVVDAVRLETALTAIPDGTLQGILRMLPRR